MKDKRSWDWNKSTHTARGGWKVSGEKVTRKAADLQLGNTWAAEKLRQRSKQSPEHGNGAGEVTAAGVTAQPRHLGAR